MTARWKKTSVEPCSFSSAFILSHSLTDSLSLFLSHALSLSLSLSLKHTHAHTHSDGLTHSLRWDTHTHTHLPGEVKEDIRGALLLQQRLHPLLVAA